ncbi:MAG: hypothetical protein IJV61_03275 [Paludibacteraceae bacterium]|nr:hypothetical protein [Paludibacteraceae bacterium]
MEAHIYIHPANFEYNGIDTESQVVAKYEYLLRDWSDLRDSPTHEENKFYVLSGVHVVNAYKQQNIYDFIFAHLRPEESGLFLTILGDTSIGKHIQEPTIEELTKQCVYQEGEAFATTMMVLNVPSLEDVPQVNPYIQFEDYQIVYGRTSWQTFRRQILGNHPGDDPAVFIEECKKYFPNLLFHENCTNSLTYKEFDCINTCPRKIIYYLSCLNDCYHLLCKEYHDAGKNNEPNDILADFSGRYGFDRAASIQGDPASKDTRTFTFKHPDEDREIDVLCDLHFKITSPDIRYKGRICGNYNPRIYFGIRNNEDYSSIKIYVGSIGEHL